MRVADIRNFIHNYITASEPPPPEVETVLLTEYSSMYASDVAYWKDIFSLKTVDVSLMNDSEREKFNKVNTTITNLTSVLGENWFMQIPMKGTPPVPAALPAPTYYDPVLNQCFIEAWKRPYKYHGNKNPCLSVLSHIKEQVFDLTNRYGTFFSMIQSSGYGKTRVLFELADKDHAFVVYIRFPSQGYPPPTSLAFTQHFTIVPQSACVTEESAVLYYVQLLLRLVYFAIDLHIHHGIPSVAMRHVYHENGVIRCVCHPDGIDSCNDGTGLLYPHDIPLQWMDGRRTSLMNNIPITNRYNRGPEYVSTPETIKDHITNLRKFPILEQPKFIIAFDESHILGSSVCCIR